MYSKIKNVLISISTLTLLVLPTLALAQTLAPDTTATSSALVRMNQAQIAAKVRTDFSDIPIMVAIAGCESKFRQFTDAGNVLDGGSGGMIGVFQIAKSVHASYALAQGYDIKTVEGNLGYARYLYSKEGTAPWISSFPCWGSSTNNPEATTAVPAQSTALLSGAIHANLSFGMVHSQIVTLQQLLNKSGYSIAPDGPGSLGNETNTFGSLTRVSVRKFQCAQNIICSGDEATTGYGYVGARTRAALLNAGTSSPATSPSPPAAAVTNTSTPEDRAVKIASLQAQIAQYQKLISDLQSQLATITTN